MVQLVLKLQPPNLQPTPQWLLEVPLHQDITLPYVDTVTGNSFPRSRLVKNRKKVEKSRRPKHKKLPTDKEAQQLAHFNRKHSVEVHNVEKDTADYASHCPVKCKLTLSALGSPL